MKARLKTGQTPGDVSPQVKAAMLEGRHPNKKRSKSFKKMILARERTVLRERTRIEVQRQLEA